MSEMISGLQSWSGLGTDDLKAAKVAKMISGLQSWSGVGIDDLGAAIVAKMAAWQRCSQDCRVGFGLT